MDVLWFFKDRLKSISSFYVTASQPFIATIAAIDDQTPPFDHPPYDESGEPAYMDEWQEATLGLDLLGRAALSMLSASLKLYFETWERDLGMPWNSKTEKKRALGEGFVPAYWKGFASALGFDPNTRPADFDLIEQIVLGRNRDQHPQEITSLRVKHRLTDLRRFSSTFFIQDSDRALLDEDMVQWMAPSLNVDAAGLTAAIAEVERLADWMEPRLTAAR
jgi:hypothetical protein